MASLLTANSTGASTPSPGSALRYELWRRVMERLQSGAALIVPAHYAAAMEEDYRALTHSDPSPSVTAMIRRMVLAVNKRHPEFYVATGLQNGVNQAFGAGVHKLGWDVSRIQAWGVPAIRRFFKADSIRDLFDEVEVRARQIDVFDCVKQAVDAVEATGAIPPERTDAGVEDTEFAELSVALSDLTETSPTTPLASTDASAGKEGLLEDAGLEEALASGDVDREEALPQLRLQERRQQELERREFARAVRYLPAYIERGILTQPEGERFKALREVDQRVQKKVLGAQEAEKLRNDIASPESRKQLERKIREAVSDVVHYIQVFESLKKIDHNYDEALHYLIRHRKSVISSDKLTDRTPAIAKLLDDEPLLNRLMDIVGRKDSEIRMLAVNFPPYSHVAERWPVKIGNWTIEESFLDGLQNMSIDDLAESLNSPDKAVRAKPAADMRCLINLIEHLVQRTRFRHKVCMLKVGSFLREQQPNLEEIFRSGEEKPAAKRQAKNFINQRLERLIPNMSNDERREMTRRSAAVISSLEQRFTRSRQPTERGGTPRAVDAADIQQELTEEERRSGVRVGRVEMRVAGNTRLVIQKLMPDPEDPEKWVIAMLDPDTDRPVPQVRRGAKRYVEEMRDGNWKIV